ncbi:hypothetical protein SESBI_04703 [Sesbania bispinosa]|nr:hypothetical protein SESBI_04703 [Sesbania bispinosa]
MAKEHEHSKGMYFMYLLLGPHFNVPLENDLKTLKTPHMVDAKTKCTGSSRQYPPPYLRL